MVEITTLRIWVGVSLVWPLFWALVFDRWFFFSPLGLIITFGIPIAGWSLWWKFYRDENQKIVSDGRIALDKGVGKLLELKKSLSKQ